MKNFARTTTIIFLALVLVFNLPIPVSFAQAAEPDSSFVQGEILVKFEPGVSLGEIKEVNAKLGGLRASRANQIGIRRVKLSKRADVEETAEEYGADSLVEFAEPNYIRQVDTVNDPLYPQQWALFRINAQLGWEIEKGLASPVVVAVVDTGVDLNHPDLVNVLVPGYDFVNNDPEPMDDNGHGTHVAGIIAAQVNNLIGVAGLSWGAKIMPVKALNAGGVGTDLAAANGIIWAVDRGAKVVNLSFGGTDFSATLQNAIAYAYSKGALVIAAAGNEAEKGNPVVYPAALDQVLAVGATDNNDSKASFSSYGSYLDLVAPGTGIISTSLDDAYSYKSGTSMAAPHVAGLAALLFSREPGIGPEEIRRRIEQSADDLGPPGRDDFYGYGRINVVRALGQVNQGRQGGGEIIGRMVNPAGQAIPGAAVRAGERVVPTNPGGEFRISGLAPGIYTIYYDAPGHLSQTQENIAVFENQTTALPTAILTSLSGEIRGIVINFRGRPVAGATVRIDNSIMFTDLRGEFRFTPLFNGIYTIHYDAPGYLGQTQENIPVFGGTTFVPTVVLRTKGGRLNVLRRRGSKSARKGMRLSRWQR